MYSKDRLRKTVHRIRTREEFDAADECKDHVQQGVSHREVINDKVLEDRMYDGLVSRIDRSYD
jgi:hypothetical protein